MKTYKFVCAASFIAAAALTTSAHATIIKILGITNPFANSTNVSVKHGGIIDAGKPNNPRATSIQARVTAGAPSDVFNGAGINGRNIGFFAGTLNTGATDKYRVVYKGTTKQLKNDLLVNRIAFSSGATKNGTLTDAGENNLKMLKKNVAGFTGEEYFDFSNNTFNLLNSVSTLEYTLTDFALYKDMPISQFDTLNFMDTAAGLSGGGSLVTSLSSYSLATSLDTISFGVTMPDTYVLAIASGLSIFDTVTGETTVFSGTYAIADDGVFDANAVPLPPTLLLFASGLLGLAGMTIRKKAA